MHDLPPKPTRRSRLPASPNGVLAIVCVGVWLANLDLLIVNVALPDMSRSLGDASLDDMSWVLNGYAIAYAALLILFGRAAERHRRNTSFLVGVGVFTVASAACAMANSVTALVLFRLLQAAGGALMTPTSLGLLLASFPPERRGVAVRIWTAVGGLAAAMGPLLGGALVAISWRWIFLVNVPIGILAIAIGYWKLPDVPGHEAPLPNPWAALLITAGIAALVLAIVKVNDWGWVSPGIAISVAVAVVCLALFVRHCLRSANPFVDPALFRIAPFTGAALFLAPYSMAFAAILLSVPLWEQNVWHWTALKSGLTLMPGPMLVPITAFLVGGRLLRWWGPAPVLSLGTCFLMAGFVVDATCVGAEPSAAVILLGMVPTGIGLGLTFPTAMAAGTSALPTSSFSTGSGVINMIRQAAMAIGVALFVAIIGGASSPLAGFERGWWTMVAILALGFPPLLLFRAQRR